MGQDEPTPEQQHAGNGSAKTEQGQSAECHCKKVRQAGTIKQAVSDESPNTALLLWSPPL
jgi:hypothetical protein